MLSLETILNAHTHMHARTHTHTRMHACMHTHAQSILTIKAKHFIMSRVIFLSACGIVPCYLKILQHQKFAKDSVWSQDICVHVLQI